MVLCVAMQFLVLLYTYSEICSVEIEWLSQILLEGLNGFFCREKLPVHGCNKMLRASKTKNNPLQKKC